MKQSADAQQELMPLCSPGSGLPLARVGPCTSGRRCPPASAPLCWSLGRMGPRLPRLVGNMQRSWGAHLVVPTHVAMHLHVQHPRGPKDLAVVVSAPRRKSASGCLMTSTACSGSTPLAATTRWHATNDSPPLRKICHHQHPRRRLLHTHELLWRTLSVPTGGTGKTKRLALGMQWLPSKLEGTWLLLVGGGLSGEWTRPQHRSGWLVWRPGAAFAHDQPKVHASPNPSQPRSLSALLQPVPEAVLAIVEAPRFALLHAEGWRQVRSGRSVASE